MADLQALADAVIEWIHIHGLLKIALNIQGIVRPRYYNKLIHFQKL